MTRRAAIYARISDDREGRELGVERQRADCEEIIARSDWTLVDTYTDNDLSASTKSTKRRPDYQRLLADARAGRINVIVAYSTSRLTRRPREHEDLIDLAVEHGVSFTYVRSPSFDLGTAQGRQIARTLAAQDASEAEQTAERVQRFKLQAATDGLPSGGRRAYGYEPDGVTIRESEAAEVRRMSRELLAGTSLNALAAGMNERGLLTSTGKPWRQDSVRDVLMRARNAGLRRHQGEVIGKAAWEAIVPEGIWRAVVALLSDPKRRTNYTTTRVWLGGNLFLCGVCDDGVTTVKTSKTTNSRPQAQIEYTCAGGVKHLTRSAAPVDELVAWTLIERLALPDAQRLLERGNADERGAALQEEARALRGRLDDLAALFAEKVIDKRQLGIGSTRLKAELTAVEQRINETGPGRGVLAKLIGGNAEAVAERWQALDLGQRRTAVDAVMVVSLMPSPKGRPKGWRPNQGAGYLRPESVRVEWRE